MVIRVRKLIMILFVLLPIVSYGQLFEHQNSFYYVGSGVDVANVAGWGEGISGYNGTFNLGVRNHKMNMQLTYETFPNRDFWSIGAGGSWVFNHEGRLNFLVGAQASLIWRDVEGNERGRDPSAALNLQLEYHFIDYFIYIRNEGRYRGDIKAMYGDSAQPYVASVFVGVAIKVLQKRN